jgi:hypothetical protein
VRQRIVAFVEGSQRVLFAAALNKPNEVKEIAETGLSEINKLGRRLRKA